VSYSVDVNVLLYASDAGCDEHPKAAEFVAACAADKELWCVAWLTLMSYMRMATHPAIFSTPLSHEEAARNVDGLLALPQLRMIDEGPGFWVRYREVAQEAPVRGNLVPDAHLVTVLRQHGVKTIYTRDRDFRKFGGLKVIDPIA